MSAIFTEKELAKYSITKALNQIIRSQDDKPPGYSGELSGLEREVDAALKSRFANNGFSGFMPMGFLLPLSCLKAANNVTTATQGGFLVGSEFASSVVPALRNKAVTVALGATVFEGLKGDCIVPKQTATAAPAQWLAELQTADDSSDMTFGKRTLTPHRCVALARLSRQLLDQSSLGVENFIRNDLLSVVGLALDKAALVGSGNVEPLGILNRDDVNTLTFGAAATRTKTISFQRALADDNAAAAGSLGYVTSPAVAEKWMEIAEHSTSGIGWLWQGDINQGTVAGAAARSTNQISSSDNRVVCGSWPSLVFGIWGDALDVIVDTFTYKKQGIVEVMVTLLADCGLTNPESFCISTDAGNL